MSLNLFAHLAIETKIHEMFAFCYRFGAILPNDRLKSDFKLHFNFFIRHHVVRYD